MKKLFMVAAIFSVVMISSTALAANWVEVCSMYGAICSVDKDSIKRGVYSERYNISRSDGFSAIFKADSEDGSDGDIHLIGFWSDEDGNYCYALLDKLDGWGEFKDKQSLDFDPVVNAVEENDWSGKIFDYIRNNLP